MDDTNLWAGLREDNDAISTLVKGHDSIKSWGNNLLAVGGELRPDKCMYTLHEMRPTGTASGSTSKRECPKKVGLRRQQMAQTWMVCGK